MKAKITELFTIVLLTLVLGLVVGILDVVFGKVLIYVTEFRIEHSMLCELIDTIHVYQAERKGKERQQKVEINYRFLAGFRCGLVG